MMKYTRHSVAAVLVVLAVSTAFSQVSEQEIRARLDAVYAGKADQVSREVTTLLEQHPHDAGVLYLQAVLTKDGALAVKRYQAIADTYPESVWADDALYKLYQYDFSLGLYKKADDVMELLRSRYPQSIYASADSKPTGQSKDAPAAATQPSQRPAVPAAATDTPKTIEKKTSQAAAPAVAQPAKPVQQTEPVAQQAKPVQHAETAAQQAVASGKYCVQVGMFSTEANARKAVAMYSAKAGRQATFTSKTVGDKTLYPVRFDGFETAESARSFSATLRNDHKIDSFVFPTPNPNAH